MKDESGEVTSEVQGEGVIGKFPTLVPGRLIVIFSLGYSGQCRTCPGDGAVLTAELLAAVVVGEVWLACVFDCDIFQLAYPQPGSWSACPCPHLRSDKTSTSC